MPRRFTVVSTLLLCLVGRAEAAQSDASTSAAFLKIPIGARNAAMGGTGAVESSVYSPFWNPAGLAAVSGRQAAYSYSSWLAETSLQTLGYAQATPYGTFAVAFQYVSIPAIQKYDNTGAAVGAEYRPVDSMLGVSYARKAFGVLLGGSLKGLYSKLEDSSAHGAAVDLGARLDPLFGTASKFSLGLTVQNMGPGLRYVGERRPLPLNLRIGAGYAPLAGAVLCLDVDKSRGADTLFGLGAEYLASVAPGMAAGPRVGYQSGKTALEGLAGLTTGLGLAFKTFDFDYAFVPMGDFGDTHRLSLKARF